LLTDRQCSDNGKTFASKIMYVSKKPYYLCPGYEKSCSNDITFALPGIQQRAGGKPALLYESLRFNAVGIIQI
jgi:hypothetical protein